MPSRLSKKEAIAHLGIGEKTFTNYYKDALEFPFLERKGKYGRFYFDKDVLTAWKQQRDWRTVELDINDYALCLDFALAQHFRHYFQSDFGTGRQREFGQKITNWVKGQLGEVAVRKFFWKEFNFDVEIDFDIHDDIVVQDIVGVHEGTEIRAPRIGIGIKSSKPKSSFLVLSENEIKIDARRSDVYIFCRPNIPDDHLLRITNEKVREVVKNQLHYPQYKNKIPEFVNIPCEIAGWCYSDDLRQVSEIPGQPFDGIRYVRESGLLRKNKSDWDELIQKL